jgi:fumarate reductase flavoprotein subunit
MQEDHPSIDYRERKLLSRPGMRMHVVFDHGIFLNASAITLLDQETYRGKFGEHPNFVRADTLQGLAEQLEVPIQTLERTVAEYNQAVAQGHDDQWQKHFLIRPLVEPPFYAIRAMGITVLSPAGLRVDQNLRVLRDSGEPIANLYAAGEVLGFGRTSGNAFVGGLSLTPALTFGRLLGEQLLSW